MRSSHTCSMMAAICICLAAGRVHSQWEIDGPGAALRINGASASAIDPIGHDVGVPVPSTLLVDILSGSNAFMPVLLAASGVNPDGTAIRQIPGLGIINIGAAALPLPTAIQLIGDGIGRSVNPVLDALFVTDGSAAPRLRLPYALGPTACSIHIALQSVVVDPTMSPFMLDMTETADVTVGSTTIPSVASAVLVHGNALSLPISLGGGYRFEFHGVSYTTIHVAKAGYITFGAPTSLGPIGNVIDSFTFAGAEPAIAAWIANWNPQRWGPADGVFVRRTDNVLEVRWGDPLGMPSGAPGIAHTGDLDANRFGIRMVLTPTSPSPCVALDPNFGAFDVSIDGVSPNTTAQPGDGIIGHTPGGAGAQASGIDRDLHASGAVGPGICMLEEHDASDLSASILGWNGDGTPRHYNDIRSSVQTTVSFLPVTNQIPGDGGYASSADRPAVSDVNSIVPTSWLRSGGETVTIIGKFTDFNDATGSGGHVDVVDAASTVVPATVIGIRDSSGASLPALPNSPNGSSTRDGEALVVMTPSMIGLAPPLALRVSFQNGFTRTLPLPTYSVVPSETFSPGDDGVIRYNLRSMPIRFYGTTYTEMFISANGICSFIRPNRSTLVTTGAFLNTLGEAPNPSVAVLWTDLAPPAIGPGGQVMVTQNPSTGTTSVAWVGFQYFVTITNCGPFSVDFAPADLVQLNLSGVTSAAAFTILPLVISGVSDGTSGPDIFLNGMSVISGTAPGTSLYHSYVISSAAILATTLGGVHHFQDSGANGTWNVF